MILGRAIAAIALLVGLSGCNLVVSIDPWFSEADTQGAPDFRDGLWLSVTDDCEVDTAQPSDQWPACAGARIFREGEWVGAQWGTNGDVQKFAGWQPQPALIVAGEPLIVQVYIDEQALGADAKEVLWRYFYAALLPTEFDGAGKVVAYQSWGVRCGPEPSVTGTGTHDDPYSDVPGVTEKPFPGLKIVDDSCMAESAAALRQAAVLSEALDKPSKSRWVRDAP